MSSAGPLRRTIPNPLEGATFPLRGLWGCCLPQNLGAQCRRRNTQEVLAFHHAARRAVPTPVRASGGGPEDRDSARRSSGGVPPPVRYSTHFTRTGLSRSVLVPSPSWPESSCPQQYVAPPVVTPQVCATPLGGNLDRDESRPSPRASSRHDETDGAPGTRQRAASSNRPRCSVTADRQP